MRRMMLMAGMAVALVLPTMAAQALPKYAEKEKKPCIYCHVKATGVGGLNARGVYYSKHNHSFEGYTETTEGTTGEAPKKTGPPAFKPMWRMELPDGTRRIAVADVAGDKKPRLLVLGQGSEVAIYRMTPTAIEKEATVDLGPGAAKFVAGSFAKDKPAVIAAPGVIVYRSGDTYAKKNAPDLKDITGAVRFADGSEYIYYYEGGMPDVYGVDLSADKPLTAGKEMVQINEGAGVYRELIAHAPQETLAQLNLPEQITKSGVIGVFDPRANGNLYGWAVWTGEGGPMLTVVDAKEMGMGEPKPIWSSPKLTGKVLDVATGMDPKEGKQYGIYVLQTLGQEDKQRMVQFFVLD